MNNYFSEIYCYSLPESKDRRESILSQCEKLGLRITLIDAIKVDEAPHKGIASCHYGANLTMISILQDAKSKGLLPT